MMGLTLGIFASIILLALISDYKFIKKIKVIEKQIDNISKAAKK